MTIIYRQNNERFKESLSRVLQLPDFVADKARYLRGVLDEWQNISPLVADVVSGRTTFESEIMPLVTAYQTLAYDTPEFEVLAKKTEERFSGILVFSQQTVISAGTGMGLVLPLAIDVTRSHRIRRRHKWLLAMSQSLYSFFEPKILSVRREFAERLLAEAQQLDKCVRKICA